MVYVFMEYAKNLDFKMEIDSKVPSVLYGDEVRARQIINNFLSNAVKYTTEGSVTLSIQCKGSTFVITLP